MSNHLVIAGTGRSGTSFIVQFLAICGLETHLTAHPDEKLDENANAGLEDTPIAGYTLPYVVKSPWLFELIDELVERTDITLDAVIMPIRDIVEAATSRVILEMRARYGNEHLDPEIARWENWAQTPGGVVYSLNPIDQARILALGFHKTVGALVRKDIPIIFLDFPRLVNDADYLWAKLGPILQHRITREDASAAHSKLADKGKVRAGKEIGKRTERAAVEKEPSKISKNPVTYPDHETLDRAALVRELTRLRGETKRWQVDVTRWADEAARLRAETDQQRNEMAELRTRLEQSERTQDDAKAAAREFEDKLMHAEMQLSDRLKSEYETRLANDRRETRAHILALEQTITALRASSSWRITRPLRTLSQWLRGAR